MMSLRSYLLPLCALALLSCTTERAGDALSPSGSRAFLADAASGPSASGHASLTQQPSGALRTFSFHARVMPDGTVEGEYDNHNRQGGFVNHGDIDCIRLIGTNGAVMSGLATRSTNPIAPEGSVTIFRVEDNGEGDDAVDRVSPLALFPAGATQNCMNFTPVLLLPIEGGNLQVRP